MRVELNQAKNGCAIDEVERGVEKLLVYGLHAFLGERAVSVQLCLPHLPKRGSSPDVSAMVAVHRSTPRGPKRSLNSVPFG
jgi:hypothetical protein